MTPITAPTEGRQILSGVDWAQYETCLGEYEGRHFRLTYDRGTLEIMTVSPWHERAKKLLARLLEALAEEIDLPLLGLGNLTLREESIGRGLEPDDCWYIQHESSVRDKKQIDLQVDPPPDLVAEVEVTRSALDRMQIYAALKVPEVWRFDGETLVICLLGKNGEYSEAPNSPTFPQKVVEGLPRFLAQWDKVEQTRLIKSFREWVRAVLASQSS
jgi:Uma2 family endonuclease